ncbi:uncharacterized protein LOC141851512 [Brevipalpus obovatus]|uniref:uncharacterized protein LOC141851512 n=1 Tax=Brevipalpus obovatus TaxID=246614 RepID=UPI003D9E37D3
MNLNQSRVKILDDIESLQRGENQLNELQNELKKGKQERPEQGDCFSIVNDRSSPKNDKSPGPSIKMVTIMSGDSSPTSSSSSTNSPISDTDQNKQHLISRYRSKYHTNKDDITHHRFHQLEEELKVTRERLIWAENSLSTKKWSAPHPLQLWLQLTHELELTSCIARRQAAEAQLMAAKEGCDKLRRKRSSFLGSFRVAHGSSIDNVDGKIGQAKRALSEVTKELKERVHRWQQIENLCGFDIVANKGLPHIQAELFAGGNSCHSVNESADLSGASDVDTTASGTGMIHEIEANDYSAAFGLQRTSSFARSSFRRSIRSNHSFDRSSCLETPSSPRHFTFNKKDYDSFNRKDSNEFGDYNSKSFDLHSNQNVSHYSATNCSLISPDSSVFINPLLLSPRHRRTWSSIRRHPRRRNPPSTEVQLNGQTLGSEKSFSLSILGPELDEPTKTSNRLTKNTVPRQATSSGIIRKPSKVDQHSIESELNPLDLRTTDHLIKIHGIDDTVSVGDQNDTNSNTDQLDDISKVTETYAQVDGNRDKAHDKILGSFEIRENSDGNQVSADINLEIPAKIQPEQEAIASTSQNLSRSEPCVSQESSDNTIDPVRLEPSQEEEKSPINEQDLVELEASALTSSSHGNKKTKRVWFDYLRSAQKSFAFLASLTRKKSKRDDSS